MAGRNKHSLSHYRLLTGDMGKLLPCGLVEVHPGDTFQHSTAILARMSPLQSPVYHPVTVRVHHFFVPTRLVWTDDGGNVNDFEEFITGGADGNDASVPPTINTTGTANDLLDYLGVPTHQSGIPVNACPVRAFNLIFNEWYRDQDLVTERTEDDVTVPNISWEKDYFTTARPWSQKGDAVTLPLGEKANVSGLGVLAKTPSSTPTGVWSTGGGNPTYNYSFNVSTGADSNVLMRTLSGGAPDVYANLSTATAADVNAVRRAFAIQRFQEARAQYGSRYSEYLRYCGVRSSDARLDRPEFLGGGSVRVSMSEVLQTAPEGATDPHTTAYGVGDMYGHGIAAMRSNAYRRFFEEHGYVLSLLSVRPKAMYTAGIQRHWLRQDKEDFYQKELEYIGQQAIWNNEVYAVPSGGSDTWGYSDRYAEYRSVPSGVSGEFRTSTMHHWHLAREFGAGPALNSTFIECDPSKRIFNEQTQHSMWVLAQHSLVARRMVGHAAPGRII